MIDVRRLVEPGSVEALVRPAEIVRDDENDFESGGCFGTGALKRGDEKQPQGDGRADVHVNVM